MANKRYTPKKKKICVLCSDGINISYKDTAMLRRFLSDRGKILARRVTGSCAFHQRMITSQIKIARHLSLLPFVQD